MKERLEAYFAEWDPMDFIKDLGAPKDEYSLEAKTLVDRYRRSMSGEEVGKLTYDIFIELIETDYEGFREECSQRGPDIKLILEPKS